MSNSDDVFARLRPIGWSDDAELVRAAGSQRVARVIGQHRSGFDVAEFAGDLRRVQPPAGWTRPRGDPELRAVVGDWITLDEDGKNILTLLPRHALLKRGAAGEHYRQQLSDILEHFETLKQVDTSTVPPTASVLPLRTVMREDAVRPSLPTKDALANAPDQADGYFRVRAVFAEE